MSRYNWIIDSGHSGEAFGIYLTDGKRSPEVPPGFYEGVMNRQIGSMLTARLKHLGVDIVHINSGPVNARETEKVDAANRIQKAHGNAFYLALHCNAAAQAGWSSAKGVTVFHAPERVLQGLWSRRTHYQIEKRIAGMFADRIATEAQRINRGVKEANFYVLRAVKCPSILIEMGFMTNKEEAGFMLLQSGLWTAAIADVILDIESNGYGV